MRNERGIIDPISIVVIIIVLGIMMGGVYMASTIPCDPATQHCIGESPPQETTK